MNNWSTILKHFEQDGFYRLTIKFNSTEFEQSMRAFLSRPINYRKQFRQSEFGAGFDGYSFPGQRDSINQAYDDALHSMVLSDYFPVGHFPEEFRELMIHQYQIIKEHIFSQLDKWGVPDLNKYTCSVSVNYYPPSNEIALVQKANHRLTEHIDGSLFTFFPFGNDDQLEMNILGEWRSWPENSDMICFPGYLAQLSSGGKIKALNHRLKWSQDPSEERFSYAFFVVPKNEEKLKLIFDGNEVEWTSAEYYRRYLALFD